MNNKTLALAAVVGGLALTLSACGSTSTKNTAANTGQNSYGNSAGNAGRVPGTSGLVAAVNGSTAQVQSTSAQTAVSWTSSTTFEAEAKTTLSAIKVGYCVQASRARTGSAPSTSTTGPLPAATVRIISTSGGCTNAMSAGRFGNGAAPSGRPTNLPTNMPTNMPGRDGRGFGNFATIGVVSSVSSSGFVVKPIAQTGSSASPVTVTTSSSTTVTETKKSSASAVKVGICLSANGTTDSTGAVTARRITLSQPTNGVCTQTGFGGGFPGGRPGGQGGLPGGGPEGQGQNG